MSTCHKVLIFNPRKDKIFAAALETYKAVFRVKFYHFMFFLFLAMCGTKYQLEKALLTSRKELKMHTTVEMYMKPSPNLESDIRLTRRPFLPF